MSIRLSFVSVLALLYFQTLAQPSVDSVKLENPISATYLENNLSKVSPRLILTPTSKKHLKQQIVTNPVVENYYAAIKLNGQKILTEPLLKRIKTGRRLLSVSRKMLYRMGILGIIYSMEEDHAILQRINDELLAVCDFSDWNPSHYLDVAEMSLALALAIDWVGHDLPENTVKSVKDNLIIKGIKPSYNKKGNVGWISNNNNWNQVCHAGMIAASIVIAEEDPELAAKTIHRALEGIPYALVEYGPHGVYPEGSTYWGYGTSFSVMTSSMLQSAFGKDFGLAKFPAFLESADFRLLANAPSGMYYNYADCGDRRSQNGDIILAWFATHTGNSNYLERERFLRRPSDMGELSRIAGPGIVWLSQFEAKESKSLPTAWKGDGSNPIVIFKNEAKDPRQYYMGAKGGRGSVNHGNMDAGSFIFELNGVRWVIDPGNQGYHDLEKTGFNLWGRCQTCERWDLLTKNNFGHSTISVNDQLHLVDGMAEITKFKDGIDAEVAIDLTPIFGNNLKSANRRFVKNGPNALLVEDQIEKNDSTRMVTWQLLTTAAVELKTGGATLRQNGETLTLQLLTHPDYQLSVISLDPPPHALDRKIEGLKRLELRIPGYQMKDMEVIKVRLQGE